MTEQATLNENASENYLNLRNTANGWKKSRWTTMALNEDFYRNG